jgi:asparagine synthase (glutamine-hydrolysing)
VSAEELRVALAEAVAVRSRGDHPGLACTLSGGIDSSAVAALASRSARVEAFCISFPDSRDYDEAPIAARTAAHLGIPLHVVSAPLEALWSALPDAVAQSEGLAVNLHLPAKWLLARAVKRAGFSVLLTGEGADEVLAGYPHLRSDLLHARGASTATLTMQNEASAGLMMPEGDGLDTSGVARVLGFVPSFLAAKAGLGRRACSLLAPEVRASLGDAYEDVARSLDVSQLRGRDRIDQSTYVWCKLALAGYILRTLGDGTEMAHAVEGRVPFLDHRFFEVARAARVDDKIRGDVEKHVLREAMKADLPEEVIARRKHPLVAPPLLLGGLTAQLGDALASGMLPPFFDASTVRATLERLGRADAHERKLWDPPLMMALTATLLGRRYGLAA